MMCTKETFLIHVVCVLLALVTLFVDEKFFHMPSYPMAKRAYSETNLNNVCIVFVLIMLLSYTGFFVHWEGIIDFFRSFAAWFHTGTGGNGHDKPFIYWFQLFCRYEWPALIGLALAFKIGLPFLNDDPESRRSHWLRLFAIYGTGTFVAYSLIPYKTPWCILQLAWPFFILTASVLEDLLSKKKWKRQLALITFAVFAAASTYKGHKPHIFS